MYKGYFIDSETKWYYLKTRYYNSNIGRFINSHEHNYPEKEKFATNLFAYCSNNLIKYIDSSGQFGVFALLAITTASMLIGGAAQLVSNAIAGKSGDELWRSVLVQQLEQN